MLNNTFTALVITLIGVTCGMILANHHSVADPFNQLVHSLDVPEHLSN